MAVQKRKFNKKIFALILEKARGDRTVRQFAKDCKISYVQLHKLEMCGQENAPGIKLMGKLAENAAGGIELEDFLFAAGIDEKSRSEQNTARKNHKSLDIQSMYEKLSYGQQKTVYDFADYLLNFKS